MGSETTDGVGSADCELAEPDLAAESHEMRRSNQRARNRRRTPAYITWMCMVQRCHNKNHDGYLKYGGAGIVVCDRWRRFENFLADMGERPSRSHSIDRIDNDRGYEPGNCRWATPTEQHDNILRPLGEARVNARLTESQVVAIRSAYAAGNTTLTELAGLAGVAKQTISQIVRGKKWAHAAGPIKGAA